MLTEMITSREDGIIMAGASNGKDDYLLWQRSDSEAGNIYFEYNDQLNSGYDILEALTLDNDGCHLVLENGKLVHFVWHPTGHENLDEFVSQLKEIYSEAPSIINDLR